MSDKFTCNKTFPPHPDSLWMSEDQRTAYPEGVTPPTRDSIDNWQMLAGEIIKFAAQDYYDIKVLKALNEVVPDDYIPPVLLRQDRRTVSFFKSRWFACLCGLDPQATISALDKHIERDLPIYRKEIEGMSDNQLKKWVSMLLRQRRVPDTSDGYGLYKPEESNLSKKPREKTDWPEEDVQKLRELCDGTLSTADVAQRLARTLRSVSAKRRSLLRLGEDLPVRGTIIKRERESGHGK